MHHKARAEALSDGVFAIAATLLILEIKVPHGASSNTALAWSLLDLWPSFLAFTASFATIFVIWLNHHGLFTMVERVDRKLLLVNGFFLLSITFIPFPTAVLAEHLRGAGAMTAAVFYCASYVLVNAAFHMLLSAVAGQGLASSNVQETDFRRIRQAYWWGGASYLCATLLSAISPLSGVLLCSILWVLWLRLDYLPRAA